MGRDKVAGYSMPCVAGQALSDAKESRHFPLKADGSPSLVQEDVASLSGPYVPTVNLDLHCVRSSSCDTDTALR